MFICEKNIIWNRVPEETQLNREYSLAEFVRLYVHKIVLLYSRRKRVDICTSNGVLVRKLDS